MFWSSSIQNIFFCDYINLCAMIDIIVFRIVLLGQLPVCYILLSYAIVFVFIYFYCYLTDNNLWSNYYL